MELKATTARMVNTRYRSRNWVKNSSFLHSTGLFCFFLCVLCSQLIYEYVLSVTVRFIVTAFTFHIDIPQLPPLLLSPSHLLETSQEQQQNEEKQPLFCGIEKICCIQFGSNKSSFFFFICIQFFFSSQICRLMIASYHKQPPKYTQNKRLPKTKL